MNNIVKRDLLTMFLLSFVTFGIYYIYWTVKTKNVIKSFGADIPSAILSVLPLIHFYFWYKFSVGYAKYIKKNERDYISYFLLTSCLPFISMFVIQNELNHFQQ